MGKFEIEYYRQKVHNGKIMSVTLFISALIVILINKPRSIEFSVFFILLGIIMSLSTMYFKKMLDSEIKNKNNG